jgi:predicted Rdx family selenoprotein
MMKRIIVTLILLLLTLGVESVMGSGGSQGNNCQGLTSQIAALRGEKAELQEQLEYAAPREKPAIALQIKRIEDEIADLQLQLQLCQAAQGPVGSTCNKAKRISAALFPDGRAEVFMVGLDSHMFHSIQPTPNSPFPDFGGGLVGSSANLATDIAAVRMPDGHAEAFMVGLDGRMWRSSQHADGGFPDDFALKPVGSSANKAQRITAVALPDGRADVFMIGLDGHIFHSVQSSPNGAFPDFGGGLVGSPANLATDIAAVRMPNGHVEVFIVGLDGRMWRSSQHADGSFPDDFALKPVGSSANRAQRITAVALPDGRAVVIMIGLDGHMFNSLQSKPNGTFPDFAGGPVGSSTNIATEIKAARLPDGRIEVFTIGADGRMWRSL